MSERLVASGVSTFAFAHGENGRQGVVVDRIETPNAPALEWKMGDAYMKSHNYTGYAHLFKGPRVQQELTLESEEAERMREHFDRDFASNSSEQRDPKHDCHYFVESIAYQNTHPLVVNSGRLIEEPLHPSKPYRILNRHSFYTTDNPEVTLSVIGVGGLLAIVEQESLSGIYGSNRIHEALPPTAFQKKLSRVLGMLIER